MSSIQPPLLQVTQVGILPSATFSSDGRIYRCSLAERSEGVSLASLAPLAVRVHCAGVEGVSNNERNRAKVARRLEGGRLTMSIGRKGAPLERRHSSRADKRSSS